MPQSVAVILVVGLNRSLLTDAASNIKTFANAGTIRTLNPVLPAITCSVQSSMLTGLDVSDHGIGISEEDQGRIFQLGERIDRTETARVAGAGLGLYIVKELAELMGGEVWVNSELNRGSAFYFTLPATA